MGRFGSPRNSIGYHYVLFPTLYPPHISGIENFTYSLSHALIERGNEVLVVMNNTNGLDAEITVEDGARVLRLSCFPFLRCAFTFLR